MMDYKTISLITISLLIAIGLHAQETVNPRKLGEFEQDPIKNLEEVNALLFKPVGYDTVVTPQLPDSLGSLQMLSKEEMEEIRIKRIEFNPYLVFGTPIELKGGDIFVGFSHSWIRLSSYYTFNHDDISAEELGHGPTKTW